MGKLSCDPVIHHFGHHHPLELTNLQPCITTTCSGCKLALSGWFYSCKICNYFLHISCSQMPQLINHPVDLAHSLTLLLYPAYPEGFFNCDACGRQSNGFSYHCAPCNLDLHILCASMPLTVTHRAHHHPLSLAFFPPYENKGFSCDVCKNLGSSHWLYRCAGCEFDAHLKCATANPRSVPQVAPVQIQRPQLVQQQRMVQRGTPQFQGGYGGVSMNVPQLNCSPNYYMYNQNSCVQQPIQPGMAQSGQGNGLMDEAIQGLVGGAAEQMGQSLMQSIIDGGDAAAAGNGGDDSNSPVSILDIGSSVLGGMFGGSDS